MLSTTAESAAWPIAAIASRSASFSNGLEGFPSRSSGVGANRRGESPGPGIDIAEIQIGRATPHPLEQPIRATVEIVADQDVRAVVQQFQHGGDGGQTRGEGKRRVPSSRSATQRSKANRVGLWLRP